jgi:hypothetical protein
VVRECRAAPLDALEQDLTHRRREHLAPTARIDDRSARRQPREIRQACEQVSEPDLIARAGQDLEPRDRAGLAIDERRGEGCEIDRGRVALTDEHPRPSRRARWRTA